MRAMKKEPVLVGLETSSKVIVGGKSEGERSLGTNWKSWPALPERLFWKK